jgi:hypothetical protein
MDNVLIVIDSKSAPPPKKKHTHTQESYRNTSSKKIKTKKIIFKTMLKNVNNEVQNFPTCHDILFNDDKRPV